MNPNIPDWHRNDAVHKHIQQQVAQFGVSALKYLVTQFGEEIQQYAAAATGKTIGTYIKRTDEHTNFSNPTSFPEHYEESAHTMAILAKEASKPQNERSHVGNWKHLPTFGNEFVQVHERASTGHWAVTVRGSHLRPNSQFSPTDWHDNAQHFAGFENTKTNISIKKHIKRLTNIHKSRFPDGKFWLGGHSLGGVRAAYSLKDPQIRHHVEIAHHFSMPGSYFREEDPDALPSHSYNHSTGSGDMIGRGFPHNTGATNVKHDKEPGRLGWAMPWKSHWYNKWEKRKYWDDHAAKHTGGWSQRSYDEKESNDNLYSDEL